MRQCNITDYGFLSNVWKNTCALNGFIFMDKIDYTSHSKKIKNNLINNSKKNTLFKYIIDDSKRDVIPLLIPVKKINYLNHMFSHTVDGEKEIKQKINEISKKQFDMTQPMWELHEIVDKSNLKSNVVLFRIHHVLGDGSTFKTMFGSLFDNFIDKKRDINFINNSTICKNLYILFKIIYWLIFGTINYIKQIFSQKLTRHFSDDIYVEKWKKEDSHYREIDYKIIKYDLFKKAMNNKSIDFTTLLVYLYSKTYRDLSVEDVKQTSLIGIPVKLKGKNGTQVYTMLCDTHLNEINNINDIKKSIQNEKNIYNFGHFKYKLKTYNLSPFKKSATKAWKEFFPRSTGAYASSISHDDMEFKLNDMAINGYFVVQPYPEIHGALGISVNIHKNKIDVFFTVVYYNRRFLNGNKFIDKFIQNLNELT